MCLGIYYSNNLEFYNDIRIIFASSVAMVFEAFFNKTRGYYKDDETK